MPRIDRGFLVEHDPRMLAPPLIQKKLVSAGCGVLIDNSRKPGSARSSGTVPTFLNVMRSDSTNTVGAAASTSRSRIGAPAVPGLVDALSDVMDQSAEPPPSHH